MRIQLKKIAQVAAFGLAVASSATAQTYTQIDDFANGSDIAITGEPWYNFTIGGNSLPAPGNLVYFTYASISNLDEPVNANGYAELTDVKLSIPDWDHWAQATLGLKAENNGVLYDFAKCDGFRFKYIKANYNLRFSLQSEKDGKQVTYNGSFDDEIAVEGGWVQVTMKSFERDTYDEAYKTYPDIPFDLSKVKDIHWSHTTSPPPGFNPGDSHFKMKDFECIGTLVVYETAEEKCAADGNLGADGKCKTTTPIRLSQTPSKWNILANAASNAIVLQNLPKNAKVEAYNLQGKRIFTSGEPLKSGESGLRIAVQAKGMYIVKVSSGSKTETLRMAVR